MCLRSSRHRKFFHSHHDHSVAADGKYSSFPSLLGSYPPHWLSIAFPTSLHTSHTSTNHLGAHLPIEVPSTCFQMRQRAAAAAPAQTQKLAGAVLPTPLSLNRLPTYLPTPSQLPHPSTSELGPSFPAEVPSGCVEAPVLPPLSETQKLGRAGSTDPTE